MQLLHLLFGRRRSRRDGNGPATAARLRPTVELLETRVLPTNTTVPAAQALTAAEVQTLINNAAGANRRQDAIIAVVDREGNVLGVRVEAGVSPGITGNNASLVFAVDGALAEARTGAFFGNDQAPLTSRTIQFISQTTITHREVNSSPDVFDLNSPLRGPGFVAPIGQGAHFPPNVANTPQVDLFAIEATNRDSLLHPNALGLKVPGQNVLPDRFNIPPQFTDGKALPAPESYGFVSGLLPTAQSRGIGTLPGGIPIYKNNVVVGGIGVFFPGPHGYATFENSSLSANYNNHKPDLSLQAEAMALLSEGVEKPGGGIGIPTGFLTEGINLAGVSLDIFGPGGFKGLSNLFLFAATVLHKGNPNNGTELPVDTNGTLFKAGGTIPDGYLAVPHDAAPGAGGLTAGDVNRIIQQGIAAANATRAQIRLPIGERTKMVFAVSDLQGNILGLYRMPDATYFSVDVAVAKARNVSYYSDAAALQPVDRVPGLPPGTALTNRTFRYLSAPRFPEGIDFTPPGPFSILNVKNGNAKKPLAYFRNVLGHDAFFPQTNFHDQRDPITNQNGIVFFPGSSPLYINGVLVGGLGVSGDGVDQDDFITSNAASGFGPPGNLRVDNFFVRGVRLPYNKFPRNPLD